MPSRVHIPDEILLRRFGLVRAVGGAAWFIAVAVLYAIFGAQVWPLALGVPVLAVVTTGFFVKSSRYPRASVIASLVADAVVLGGGIAFLGGTGSGLVMLYAIVIVSAGILLGPAAASGFTALTAFLGLLQFAAEELWTTPVLLHREDVGERLPILLVSLAGLASIGYLTASYAGRLQELIAEAGEQAEVVRRRGRRRRSLVEKARVDVREPLRELEAVAESLDERWDELPDDERRRLAGRLRMGVISLEAEVSQLADVSAMEESIAERPEPVLLRKAVDDVVYALRDRLDGYVVEADVPPLKVVGNRRSVRRVLYNLLENVVQHTPIGTHVDIDALATAGSAVLVVTDTGPGVPKNVAADMFQPPDEGGRRLGLALVRELCEAMGAEIRYETAPHGGARFLLRFRLAPSSAPSLDDVAEERVQHRG